MDDLGGSLDLSIQMHPLPSSRFDGMQWLRQAGLHRQDPDRCDRAVAGFRSAAGVGHRDGLLAPQHFLRSQLPARTGAEASRFAPRC